MIEHLRGVGALPGIRVLFVAARNGPGTGRLKTSAAGTKLQWGPPQPVLGPIGTARFGPAVDISSDGEYLIPGGDADSYVRVQVDTAYVSTTSIEADVAIADRYENGVASDDVTAAEASAGDVSTYTIELTNVSLLDSDDVRIWIDVAVTGIEISDDGKVWVAPTTEATALVLGTIFAGASQTLHVRRTILAGASSNAEVLVRLRMTFDQGVNTFSSEARGLYRVFNAAVFRFFRSNVAPPIETDTPYAVAASLPTTPGDLFPDGTWFLSASFFNGVIDSGFRPLGPDGETFLRLDISDGVVTGSPPRGPDEQRLDAEAGGVVRILALYFETSALRATEWAIAFTTDGSTPPTDTPDVVVAMEASGLAVLNQALAAVADGLTVKVRIQTRRTDAGSFVYSEDSTVLSIVADAVGPSVPLQIQTWRGRLAEGF